MPIREIRGEKNYAQRPNPFNLYNLWQKKLHIKFNTFILWQKISIREFVAKKLYSVSLKSITKPKNDNTFPKSKRMD